VDGVSRSLSAKRWMSTQTTAYCLIAMTKFVKAGGHSKTMKFTYALNNGSEVNGATQAPISQINMKIKGTKGGTIKVKNTGSGVLFARVVMEGVPVAGDKSSADKDLRLTVTYKDLSGNTIDPGMLEQGTDFKAEVKVYNPGLRGHYRELALTQIFPSGWEIRNTRMDGFQNVHETNAPKYRDIRDDRVYTYCDIRANTSKTFTVILNAAYLGKFYLPTVYCEAMYDNTINSRRPGKWVEVVVPGGEATVSN